MSGSGELDGDVARKEDDDCGDDRVGLMSWRRIVAREIFSICQNPQ
jgi:hypothetical protein